MRGKYQVKLRGGFLCGFLVINGHMCIAFNGKSKRQAIHAPLQRQLQRMPPAAWPQAEILVDLWHIKYQFKFARLLLVCAVYQLHTTGCEPATEWARRGQLGFISQ